MPQSDSGSGRTLDITIAPSEAGWRTDSALAVALARAHPDPPLSRSRVKALIVSGHVASDGRTISEPSRRVKPGQTFAVFVPAAAPAALAAQELPLDIVHEDSDLIVIDKQAGLVVHPAPGNPDRTLVNALLAHCGERLSGIGGVKRPGIVHRLDKDTSGLMIAAKTDAAHHALAAAFARHEVERVYIALVWGVPLPPAGEIVGAIGRSSADRKKMAVVRKGGKAALTRYRVLRSFAGTVSLVECRLATGRTHQIRVHLASIGHPLVGDPVYRRARQAARRLGQSALPEAARAALEGFARQALDAVVLGFTHPRSGERLRFTKKYASDINELIHLLEGV